MATLYVPSGTSATDAIKLPFFSWNCSWINVSLVVTLVKTALALERTIFSSPNGISILNDTGVVTTLSSLSLQEVKVNANTESNIILFKINFFIFLLLVTLILYYTLEIIL